LLAPHSAVSLALALALGLLVGACQQLPSDSGPAKPAEAPSTTLPAQPPPAAPPPPVETSLPPPAAPGPALSTTLAPANRSATVALLVPLTGPAAPIGAALFNAAQLALFEVGDDTFTLLPFDTKGTPDGAAAAAQQAIAQHADVLLGPLFSGEARAVAPIARQSGQNVLAFTTDRGIAGNGLYVLGFLPGQQAQRIADYAASQGKPRLAILAPSNEYGRTVVDALSNAAPGSAVSVTSLQYYDPTATDLTAPIKRLVKTEPGKPGDVGFDALLLPDEGQRLRNIASMLSLQGVNPAQVKLLGTMLWDDAKPGSEPALAGGWYPAPSMAAHADFEQRYAKAFGSKPPRIASLGYDATALTAVLAKRSPHDFSAAVLTNPLGFAGVDGLFRLLPDGTAERGYAVLEVVAGGASKEVAPPPASFQAAY
jgi:ABC-type branched-subunit amino acid transport system substrate-binding protein